jgi:hypothetical protein
MRRVSLVLICLLFAACSRESNLITFKSDGDGPNEFAVLPSRPLETPPDPTLLPPPTLGGANRTDPRPAADAIVALGGSPNVARAGEGAVLAHAGRFGVSPGIRTALATEDAAFRARNRGLLLERAFNITVYYRVYAPFALDAYAELERFRAAGVRTPSVPPPPNDG